ncbi:MAG TPA: Gfo/Idh/MocA family oxidoreductase [Humisphaera sp.]
MEKLDTVRWGIIGCGDVTEVKSGPALQKATGSSLVAVMRRDAAKAADYARRHNVPRSYGDADQLINDPDVNAVYVATPPGSHCEYAVRAAAAGKPVYVEKPMARTHAECVRMIDAAKAARGGAGVPLFVAYYRRRLPRFLRFKQLVDDGAVGDVRFVTITHYQRPNPRELDGSHWHIDPAIAGAGRFLDLAPHALDVLDYVLGPVAEAGGTAANQGGHYAAEDIVTAHWRHASGALGTGVWCFTSFDRDDRIEIVGSKGTITFACFETTPVRLWTATGTQEFPEPTPPHVQQPLIQTVVDELRGVTGAKCPSTGETAARTSWVADQILRTWRERK